MSQAIIVRNVGGPDVMQWESVAVGAPSESQIRVRHTAVGLNFIDVYFRTGTYPAPQLPFIPGLEAAGVVEQIGAAVTELAVGDRVAYASPPLGAYAEERLIDADRVVKLPDSIDDATAAAMMLKGLTAQYLLRQTYPVKAGDTLLFHAAAGGVGLIACQWAKHLGATVIGTVGTDAKAQLAKAHGCDHPIVYTRENFVERVKEITNGQGVPVVYDSVGASTFEQSLDCLSAKGMMVSFGQSSGVVEPFNIGVLSAKGSLFLTRPTLMTYTARRADLVDMSEDLFAVVADGAVRIPVRQRYALSEAVAAHADLESRKTTGATVLEV